MLAEEGKDTLLPDWKYKRAIPLFAQFSKQARQALYQFRQDDAQLETLVAKAKQEHGYAKGDMIITMIGMRKHRDDTEMLYSVSILHPDDSCMLDSYRRKGGRLEPTESIPYGRKEEKRHDAEKPRDGALPRFNPAAVLIQEAMRSYAKGRWGPCFVNPVNDHGTRALPSIPKLNKTTTME
jgi:hypothetical protein